jgi:FkbM family methyltransferase
VRALVGRLLNTLLSVTPTPVLARLGRWEYEHAWFRRLARGLLAPAQATATTITSGPGTGLVFTSAGGFPGRTLGMIEPELQAELAARLRDGDTFFDGGANVGFFTLIGARLVGPGGRVVAIEPQPEAAARLRANVAANGFENVTIVEAAVADAAGTEAFHFSGEGILEWGALGAGSGGTPVIEVAVTTVDALVAEGLPPPSLVKLDVEGAELRALRGMRETIAARRPTIVCEIHGTLDETRAFLDEVGYDVRLVGGNGASGGAYFGLLLATPR